MAFAMPSLADNVKIGGINYRISGSTATVMPNNYDDSSGSVIDYEGQNYEFDRGDTRNHHG